MSYKNTKEMNVEFTPLEKIEALYNQLVTWYGDAEKKELRVAAKLLLVALDKFAVHTQGDEWHQLILEYVDILKNDPEKFQRILETNRGELKGSQSAPRH